MLGHSKQVTTTLLLALLGACAAPTADTAPLTVPHTEDGEPLAMEPDSDVQTIASALSASSGTVHGLNTVDYVQFFADNGDVISYDVSGSGNGSNELDVQIQQQRTNGSFETLVHFELDMPSDSASGSFTVHNHLSSTSEFLRFRLGRKIGTQAIDWDVSF